ncbi:MAG: biopolymer transporter ExbD [Bacteroidetes bacterium]|nr:biopolymer transporter ExbD [Bacteroidota bacterium]MBU1115400.1 biopolymer transporter ExbD [Bacteroidota bacterium]MBU1797921.1 biopolymer transporter ExbD [Bacteroidota bacterium]
MKFEMQNKPLTIFHFSSLTDIVMLLLIFFLLTSQFVIQTGVKVQLPGALNNEQTVPTRIIVSITEQGKIFVGKEEVEIGLLPLKLEDVKKVVNEENLIIRADKSSKIDLVIKVIDAAKGVGINKFTIETEKESF